MAAEGVAGHSEVSSLKVETSKEKPSLVCNRELPLCAMKVPTACSGRHRSRGPQCSVECEDGRKHDWVEAMLEEMSRLRVRKSSRTRFALGSLAPPFLPYASIPLVDEIAEYWKVNPHRNIFWKIQLGTDRETSVLDFLLPRNSQFKVQRGARHGGACLRSQYWGGRRRWISVSSS